jgi:ribonuclease J
LVRWPGIKALLCRNGDLVRLAPGEAVVIDEVPAGRLYKDGSLLIEAESRPVADRRRLAYAGIVSVALALTDKGQLAANPEVELVGIPERTADGDPMANIAYEAAVQTFESLPRPRRRDPDSVAEAVRRGVRAALAGRWGKKPLVYVQVLEV